MVRFLLCLVVLLAVSVSAYAVSDNWITNGDFSSGLAGWSIAGSHSQYIQPQIITSTDGAMLSTYAGGIGTVEAPAVTAWSGPTVAWARTGAPTGPHVVHNYIYQTVNVNPGTYTISEATWKVLAGNTLQSSVSAMFLVRVDGQIGQPFASDGEPKTLRSTKWDYQSPVNAWADKSVAAGTTFSTTTGNVQFILSFTDNQADNTNYNSDSKYSYAAYDNIVFKTVETPVVPEPSSLLALFSGAAGLAGFAFRKRR